MLPKMPAKPNHKPSGSGNLDKGAQAVKEQADPRRSLPPRMSVLALVEHEVTVLFMCYHVGIVYFFLGPESREEWEKWLEMGDFAQLIESWKESNVGRWVRRAFQQQESGGILEAERRSDWKRAVEAIGKRWRDDYTPEDKRRRREEMERYRNKYGNTWIWRVLVRDTSDGG